jgi:DNA repair protein SbcD/Mre11
MSVAAAKVTAMRFLHTSDWHLGRSLHRADLRDAQERFLDHLVATAREQKVNAVLVSGDVYDRAIPSLDAVKLFEEALGRLRDTGARVILISGNHDSARRLGFGADLIDKAGVHLLTRPELLNTPVLLEDDHGPVAVYGIPYTEPAIGLPRPAGEEAGEVTAQAGEVTAQAGEARAGEARAGEQSPQRSHQAVLEEATARIAKDAAVRGVTRTVVLAHAWVIGGEASDSERDIRTARDGSKDRDGRLGGIGDVRASVFEGLSYVALGHLHGQQTLASHVRYSGSPLPYSFSEASHRKGTWLAELGDGGKLAVERVPAPVHKRLSVLRGRLDDLLTSRQYAEYEPDFLAVTLTDTARPDQAMDRLRRRFEYVLTLDFKPEGVVADSRSYAQKVAGKDDLEVAAEFVRHVRNTDVTPGERDLLAMAFAAVDGSRSGGES